MSEIPLGPISFFLATPFLLLTIWLFYLIHVYTEKAEALMPNSRFVEANRSVYSHMGFLGKAIRNGFLTLVLLTPKLTATRGLVDVAEVNQFPKWLKRLFVASWGLCFIFFAALMTLGIYRRYLN